MDVVLLAAALLVGGLLAVQASANLQLSAAVNTPYGASTVQLMVAAGALALLAAAVGTFGAVRLVPDVTWWHLLGGLASPLYITSGILLFPRLGALAAVGLFVTGQVLASVAIDVFGAVRAAPPAARVGVAAGSVAVLAGITAIVRGQPVRAPGRDGAGRGRMAAARVGGRSGAAGAGRGQRPAARGPARAGGGGPGSFLVAALTSLGGAGRAGRQPAHPGAAVGPAARDAALGVLGGLCAVGYVTGTFLLIPAIGAAVTVALTVTGQQVAALIDGRGWFRLPRRPLTAVRAIGLALLVGGSVLVQLG